MDQILDWSGAGAQEGRVPHIPETFFPSAVRTLTSYVPGASVDEIRRRSSTEEIVKLASNECPLGPLGSAITAVREGASGLARYPDGASRRLTAALADRLDLTSDQLVVGAGADGCLDNLASAVIDASSELVCGWPSFPTPVITTQRLGGNVIKTPLRDDHHHDLEAMLAAIGPATKIVYICHPNNPTATANSRDELDAYFDAVPEHVLTVLDQAYFEYVDSPEYPNGIDYLRAGHRVAVLRTFSKIYGLAGLRIGYMVGPAAVVAAVRKVQRAFEVSATAHTAAIASLGQNEEIAARRKLNTSSREELIDLLTRAGMRAEAGAVANFVYLQPPIRAERLAAELLEHGVAIRALGGFGAPDHVRISVGTPGEHTRLDAALDAVMNDAEAER